MAQGTSPPPPRPPIPWTPSSSGLWGTTQGTRGTTSPPIPTSPPARGTRSSCGGNVCPARTLLLKGLTLGWEHRDWPSLAQFGLAIAILNRKPAKSGKSLSSERKLGAP